MLLATEWSRSVEQTNSTSLSLWAKVWFRISRKFSVRFYLTLMITSHALPSESRWLLLVWSSKWLSCFQIWSTENVNCLLSGPDSSVAWEAVVQHNLVSWGFINQALYISYVRFLTCLNMWWESPACPPADFIDEVVLILHPKSSYMFALLLRSQFFVSLAGSRSAKRRNLVTPLSWFWLLVTLTQSTSSHCLLTSNSRFSHLSCEYFQCYPP